MEARCASVPHRRGATPAAHRIFHRLHDIGLKAGLPAKIVCYGAALAITLTAAGRLLSLGF